MCGRVLHWGLIVAILAGLQGCSSLQHSGGPDPLPMTDSQRQALLSATADVEATRQAMSDGNLEKRAEARNVYVANRLVLLDAAFLQYVRSLTSNKRTLDSATEGSVLGLSVLGTLLDSARAKENLAAAVAAITGLKSNIDKNFFDNRGLDAIASMMVAKRKEVLARILKGLAGSVDEYPMVAARGDLNDYYLAGTMDGAFLTIQAEAQKREDAATKIIEDSRQVQRVSETLGTADRTTKRSLTTALGSTRATPEALRKALLLLGVPDTQPPRSGEQAAALLRDVVFSAQTAAKVNDLSATFKEAGLLP